jgi:hypothetical protein
MTKTFQAGLIAAVVLLVFSFICLQLMPVLFPKISEAYFQAAFINESSRNNLYYTQPIVLAFSLSWFWNRFRSLMKGSWILKGVEMGILYLLIATLPSMILIYSAIDVPASVVFTWLIYGFSQALIAGLIFAGVYGE